MTLNMLHKHTIMREFGICAGHSLYLHEGKCKYLHGHQYTFHVYCTSDNLDTLGRVVDFGVIKERIGNWLEEKWDHGMIMNEKDPRAGFLAGEELTFTVNGEIAKITNPFMKEKVFMLPCNPTAENLASYLLTKASELMYGTDVDISRVDCWETPKCMAEASL